MKWHWNEAELVASWTLSLAELSLLSNRTGHGRLGFAVLLKFFQQEGSFPGSLKAIPATVLNYLSEQTGVLPLEMEQ